VYAPEKTITRAEFTAILLRLLQLEPVENAIPAFTDTPEAIWHYDWIHAAINLGIVHGTGPATFEPDKDITRQEAAALIVRALKQQHKDSHPIALPYTDADKVQSI
jgi:spore germination protein